MANVLDELAVELNGRVRIRKLNVDIYRGIAARYDIKGIPTFILFAGGRERGREVAARSGAELKSFIESC